MTRSTIVLGSATPPLADWHDRGLIGGWPANEARDGLLPGDATYGYDLASLLDPPAPPPEPADFDAFWAATASQADACPPSLRLAAAEPAPGRLRETHTVQTGTFTSIGGNVIGCWVLLPRSGSARRNLTFAHGYGGRYSPDFEEELVEPDDAVILPCLRGLGALSLRPDIPAAGAEQVLHGIESREGYVLRGCVADVWRASAELDHLTGAAEHAYYGPSFGGGIGALALVHGRYRRAALHVPTFGHHPLRLRFPSIGSGAGLRRRLATDPSILHVLAYFDAMTAARRVTTPTIVCAALWDPSVPPPGQFAVYHGLAGEKQLVVQDAAHTDFPGQQAQDRSRVELLRRWLH